MVNSSTVVMNSVTLFRRSKTRAESLGKSVRIVLVRSRAAGDVGRDEPGAELAGDGGEAAPIVGQRGVGDDHVEAEIGRVGRQHLEVVGG